MRQAPDPSADQADRDRVDSALGAYRDGGRRLAAAVKGIEAVERVMRGEPL